ncbi:MAG: hypothetical protein J1F01_08615 [Oscillospiraceae bacterium]|nr:hypothetical protein [Oscillospiraceae bacterium]
MGRNNQISYLDLINIMSFVIGIMNLDENLTQGDKQDLMDDFDKKADTLLQEIHGHLESQDKKIDSIIQKLEVLTK